MRSCSERRWRSGCSLTARCHALVRGESRAVRNNIEFIWAVRSLDRLHLDEVPPLLAYHTMCEAQWFSVPQWGTAKTNGKAI
jgi:hypothetical protein